MRLTPKEAGFTLYETGFGDDLLDRAASGKALSNLAEQIEDPMVIALDGGWGTGKSWFLKRWVGQHRIDHPGMARTVYFDAFAHDYLDSPLVALTAVLTKELAKEKTPTSGKIERLKKTAFKALPGLTKLGANIATSFAVKALDDTGDILAEAIGGTVEGPSETFWQSLANQQTAMEEFTAALGALTLTEGEDTPRKLVIVVDELDRCRPDYALSLLEVIKHFFAVDHVHFVLGVNLRELENMVRVRYGTQEGAELYLQKFMTLTMELAPLNPMLRSTGQSYVISLPKIIATRATDLGISEAWIAALHSILSPLYIQECLTLRAIERILSQLVLAATAPPLAPPSGRGSTGPRILNVEDQRVLDQALMILVVLKVIFPDTYVEVRTAQATADKISELWQLGEINDSRTEAVYGATQETINTFFPGVGLTFEYLEAPLRNACLHIPKMAQHYLSLRLP